MDIRVRSFGPASLVDPDRPEGECQPAQRLHLLQAGGQYRRRNLACPRQHVAALDLLEAGKRVSTVTHKVGYQHLGSFTAYGHSPKSMRMR